MELAIIYADYNPFAARICNPDDVIACIFDHYIHLPCIIYKDGHASGYVGNHELDYTIQINEQEGIVVFKNALATRSYKWESQIVWQEFGKVYS